MDEQADPLDALFARAKKHRIPMAAICKRAEVDPTTPSRWKRGKNGATLDRLTKLNDALATLIAEAA
jgi:transcriptional regulator with XRE-family HTH domain